MSMPIDRLDAFELDHGVRTARVHYLSEGELWFAEREAGVWAVSWYPFRSDHPDAPVLVTDSKREGIDGGGGVEELGKRLEAYFTGRDKRQMTPVTIEREATPEEIKAVQSVFDEAGMPAMVSANYGRHSAVHPDWLVVIEYPLVAFVSGLAAKAAADSWDSLRRFIERLYEVRRLHGYARGWVQIDEGSRRIALSDLLPPEAFPQLAELDETGEYWWDDAEATWRRL